MRGPHVAALDGSHAIRGHRLHERDVAAVFCDLHVHRPGAAADVWVCVAGHDHGRPGVDGQQSRLSHSADDNDDHHHEHHDYGADYDDHDHDAGQHDYHDTEATR